MPTCYDVTSRFVAGASLILLMGAGLLAQRASERPTFEVVSIKPSDASVAWRMVVTQGRVDFAHVSLAHIIAQAYRLEVYQVKPLRWMADQYYEVTAKIPAGVSKDQVPAMLQAMLEDRFNLKAHRESKEQPVYALRVGSQGPKLKKPEDQSDAEPSSDRAALATSSGAAVTLRPPPGGVLISMTGPATVHVKIPRATMQSFAAFLSGRIRRPVLDRTDISGEYDIDFDAVPIQADTPEPARQLIGEGALSTLPPPPPGPPPMAFEKAVLQLGLRLEPIKARVVYLVVDSADKAPSGN